MEENVKKAKESGNVLTQTINEQGNLISVNNMNTQEANLEKNDEVSTADIRKELFEGDNVILSKDTDHGLSELNEMKEKKANQSENMNNDTINLDNSKDNNDI